ncbi:MAG: hypothetical protein L0Y71_14335 [Gemmataceae bacterium]|nr:hypothetical protein [Gemmataceae bacterium]
MATLKKPIKKKDGGKPSTVLIIFLVFFILLSIGVGVAAYYGYEGQNKLKEEAKSAKASAAAAKTVDDYRMGVILFLSSSVGHDLDQDTRVRATAALDEIMKGDAGRHSKEPDHAAFAKLFNELSKDLVFDANAKKFAANYRAKLRQTEDELKKTETQLGVTRKALQEEQAKYTAYEKKQEAFYKAALADIAKGNAAALAASTQKFESYMTLVKLNQEIQDKKLAAEAELKKVQDQLDIEKARFAKFLEEKKTDPALEVVQMRKDGEQQHALFLDISRGIPLWDRPLGKVTRVELDRRQVFINLGSAAGIRPEVTFNIFADDGKGGPDKFLKGTIEVIRVLDAQSSQCRITSLYDVNGVEIALNDPARGRTGRETEAGIRQGDLLFNMFWNSRVAVAGAISFNGPPSEVPAEQMRQLETFTQLLARLGIATDAYLDLTDGKMKGEISSKTRFLILGEWAEVKDPNDDLQKERAKLINDGIAAMQKNAIEKGIFLISAENFSIVAGYRRPRNANSVEVGRFTSSVPFVAPEATGLVIQRDRPVQPGAPPAAKKEP